MMKRWLICLLAFVVLTGSFIPCCADDFCAEEIISSTSNDPDQENGICSPFITCGSCACFIIITPQQQLQFPVPEFADHHEKFFAVIDNVFYPSFFQPPRFS